MKESPHEPLTEKQDKRCTIHCIVWAIVVVIGILALLLHGMAFLSWTEPTMEEVYRNKRMGEEIEVLKNQTEQLYEVFQKLENNYENHTHKFWTGKVKQAKSE